MLYRQETISQVVKIIQDFIIFNKPVIMCQGIVITNILMLLFVIRDVINILILYISHQINGS